MAITLDHPGVVKVWALAGAVYITNVFAYCFYVLEQVLGSNSWGNQTRCDTGAGVRGVSDSTERMTPQSLAPKDQMTPPWRK